MEGADEVRQTWLMAKQPAEISRPFVNVEVAVPVTAREVVVAPCATKFWRVEEL